MITQRPRRTAKTPKLQSGCAAILPVRAGCPRRPGAAWLPSDLRSLYDKHREIEQHMHMCVEAESGCETIMKLVNQCRQSVNKSTIILSYLYTCIRLCSLMNVEHVRLERWIWTQMTCICMRASIKALLAANNTPQPLRTPNLRRCTARRRCEYF